MPARFKRSRLSSPHQQVEMSQKFALFIGNDQYEDQTLSRLKTPSADVQGLARVMRDPAIGGFDEVTELLNHPSSSVRLAISEFFVRKKQDDLLLLYFSGHGVLDDQGRLFLAVKDTRRDLLKATAIPSAYVTGEMDDCRSKRQILILDCCHSGAFVRGAKGETSLSAATFKGNGYGRVVLTASNSTQVALEGDRVIHQAELSLFSHYLLEGLTTGDADANADGLISLDDWYDYAYAKIADQTRVQTPNKWAYSQQGDLIVAKNARATAVKPAQLPVELLQSTESPLAGVRMGAAQELERLLKSSDKTIRFAAIEVLKRMLDDDSRRVQDQVKKILDDCEPETGEKKPTEHQDPAKPGTKKKPKKPRAVASPLGVAATASIQSSSVVEPGVLRIKKHAEKVRSVAFSPDGKKVASGFGGGFLFSLGSGVDLWRIEDKDVPCTLGTHGYQVSSVAFSPDGQYIAAGSNEHTLALWQVSSKKLIKLKGHTNCVNSVVFSPDGVLLASGSQDNTVRLWDYKNKRLVRTLEGHTNIVNSVAISPDGKFLASGSSDKTVRLWRLSDGTLWKKLEGHTEWIACLSFSPDGTRLASSTWTILSVPEVRLWRISDGKVLSAIKGTDTGMGKVAYSPDGGILAWAQGGVNVCLYNVSDGKLVRKLEGHTACVNSVAFSPDGTMLVSGSDDKSARVWLMK